MNLAFAEFTYVKLRRDKPSDEILQIVRNKESPLRSTDLRVQFFFSHLFICMASSMHKYYHYLCVYLSLFVFLVPKDVLSFEVFMAHLTQEEQQKLMRYLPPVDTTNLPERHVVSLIKLIISFYEIFPAILNPDSIFL